MPATLRHFAINADDVERARGFYGAVFGGRVLMQPYMIDGVGEIGYFEDPEGNICGVAQYVEGVWG